MSANLKKSDAGWNRYQAAASGRAFLNRTDARIFTGRTGSTERPSNGRSATARDSR